MSMYIPDVWVVLEFTTPKETLRKVFAGWYGGFAGANSWQLNSGITKTRKDDECFEFDGYSGSIYRCHPNNYHMSSLMISILGKWIKQAEQSNVEIKVLELKDIKVD